MQVEAFNFILTEEEETEKGFIDAIGGLDEDNEKVGLVVEVSLHTLTSLLKRKTLKLQGYIQEKARSILIDTGSTTIFLIKDLVKILKLPKHKMELLKAAIADGSVVSSSSFCPRVVWVIQDYSFTYPLVTMDIGVWDMILSVDWMTQYSPITFDFQQMQVRLYNEGAKMVLEGEVQQPIMKLVRGKGFKKFANQKSRRVWLPFRFSLQTFSLLR